MEEAREFVIEDDKMAEWAVRKIKEAVAEHDRLMALAADEAERIAAETKAINDQYDRDTGFLKVALRKYFDGVEHKTTKTQESYKLLSGKLVLKHREPKYVKDDAAVIGWLRENKMTDYVKVSESLDWANLKKETTIVDGVVVVKDSGEVVPGVTVEAVPDQFEITF